MSKQGFILVILSGALTVSANLLLRTGVVRAGSFSNGIENLGTALISLVKEPLFDLGFILYGLATLIWFKVIATEPLNVAYPLLVSITFLFVTLCASFFFKESLNFRQIIGLGIILTGIVLVSGK